MSQDDLCGDYRLMDYVLHDQDMDDKSNKTQIITQPKHIKFYYPVGTKLILRDYQRN